MTLTTEQIAWAAGARIVRDALDRAAPFEVNRPDVGDDADVRVRPLREARDLAEVVHPALDGRETMLGTQAEQRQRYANFVVEVALGLQGRPGRAENFSN